MSQFLKKFADTPLYVKLLSIAGALLLVYGFYVFESPNYSTFKTAIILALLLIVSCISIYGSYFCTISRRTVLYCMGFSMFFTFIYIGFHEIYITNGNCSLLSSLSMLLKHIPYVLGLIIFISCLLIIFLQFISKFDVEQTSKLPGTLFSHPIALALIIFICWIPCYLSYYPGIFSYDMFAQTPQALGAEPISKFHPPLHTLLWKLFLELENLCGLNALITYSITQMIIMACCLSYVLYFFSSRRVHVVFLYISLAYFCFNPAIAIFSFIPTKDVLFSCTLILFVVEILSLISKAAPKYCDYLRIIIFGILCCLLRNNMIYALIVSAVFTCLFVRAYRKSLAICSLIIILFFSLTNGPIYQKIGIQDGNPREMLSVPMQQIAHIALTKSTELTEEDIFEIEKFIPCRTIAYYYRSRTVDLVKFNFKTQTFIDDPKSFIALWLNMFSRYTDSSLVAFFNLNIPYWYPSAASIDPNATIDPSSPGYYIETGIYSYEQTGYQISRSSILPALNSIYEEFATTAMINGSFVSSIIFSITTPIWFILLTIFTISYRKRISHLAVLFPILFLWCTYLLGPVSNCRYVFPIMLCYPVFMVLIFQSSKFTDNAPTK